MCMQQQSARLPAILDAMPGRRATTARVLSWIAAAARFTGEYGAAGIGLLGILIMWSVVRPVPFAVGRTPGRDR
jgi:hypothetical protein